MVIRVRMEPEMEKHLGSGMISISGPIDASKLVGAFEAEVFAVIEEESDGCRSQLWPGDWWRQ